MKNLKPLEIADRLKELTSIDIFENTRTQEVVKVRSLFCYLLREKLAMRWTAISQFFQHNNKPAGKEEYIMNKIDLWLKEFEWKSKLNQV